MKRYINGIVWRIRKFFKINNLRKKIVKGKLSDLKLHFGCGSNPLEEYINVDFQFSKKIDLYEDLSNPQLFAEESTKEIFSNAFFEHLYRADRIIHLKKCNSMLNSDGIICYIGLPYFLEIAKSYLNKENNFDLFNVYRLTHGDPEHSGKSGNSRWLAQLHKSLFDEFEIKDLLESADFTKYTIFKYCYPGEEGLPVNLGFFAAKSLSIDNIKENCTNYLKKFDNKKILIKTLEFVI